MEKAKPMTSHQRTLHQFAKETGVFGLHLFRHGKLGRFETAFWLLTVGVMTGLTFRDLSNLTTSYLSEVTTTSAKRQENKTIIFQPAPTLYISFNPSIRFLCFDQNETRLNAELIDFLSSYRAWNRSDSSASFPLLSDELVEVTFAIVARLTVFEYQLTRGTVQEVTTEDTYCENHHQNQSSVDSTISQVLKFYQKNSVDFVHLAQLVGAALCSRFDVRVNMTKFNRTTLKYNAIVRHLCIPRYIKHVDMNSIAVELAGVADGQLRFNTYYDKLTIAAVDPFEDPTNRVASRLWIQLEGDAGTDEEPHFDSAVQLTPDKRTMNVATVRISAVFRRCYKRKEPCASEQTRYDCEQLCQANFVLKHCNCWPLFYALYYEAPAGVRLCALPGGEKASIDECVGNDTQAGFDEIKQCEDRCLPDCETTSFALSMDSVALSDATESMPAFLGVLYMGSMTFPVFEERLEQSWDTFISQFGGALSLWLGLSFAAVLHLPIFLLRLILRAIADLSCLRSWKKVEGDPCGVDEAKINEYVVVPKVFGPAQLGLQHRGNRPLRGPPRRFAGSLSAAIKPEFAGLTVSPACGARFSLANQNRLRSSSEGT